MIPSLQNDSGKTGNWIHTPKGKYSYCTIGSFFINHKLIELLSDTIDRFLALTYRNGLRMSKKVEASGSDAIKNFGATQNESRYMFTVILALIYSVILR